MLKNTNNQTKLWIAAGILFSLIAVVCVCIGVNRAPAVMVPDKEIKAAVSHVIDDVQKGDYEALGTFLYGNPTLKAPPSDPVWDSFRESIRYQFPEECYAKNSKLYMRTQINCLDISAVAEKIEQVTMELMKESSEQGSDLSQDELFSQAVSKATASVLSDAPVTITGEITFELARSGRKWQVIPTDELVQFLYGFFAE